MSNNKAYMYSTSYESTGKMVSLVVIDKTKDSKIIVIDRVLHKKRITDEKRYYVKFNDNWYVVKSFKDDTNKTRLVIFT